MNAIVAKTKKGNNCYRFEMSESEFTDCDNNSEGCCVFCGEPSFGVEPDARKYECESCQKHGVYGMQELLLMGFITFSEEE